MENQQNIKEKVFSGLFWKFGERITAQLISLIVSILLARLLSPSDYGAVAIVMVFITIANVFVSNGFGNALIQKKDADNLDFSSVFYINILLSLILYVIIFFSASWVAEFYGMPILAPALQVLGIRIPVAAINSVQQAYVSRNMLFKRFFWSTFFGTLISGVIGIIMAYQGFGVWALVGQYLTNTCTDTIVLWFTVRWRPELKCSWNRAKGLLSYGWKLLVSGLLDTGYRQLRSLIIGKKYTSSDLAYYNQGDKYPSLIVVNINTSISSVLFPVMSQYQSDKEKVKQMTRSAIQVGSYIMWPLMIGLGVVAEPLIRIILTEKWLPCVPYMRIFCFTYGLWPIHTANLQAMNALGKSEIFLKLEIIKKGIGLVALLISMQFGPLAMAYSLIATDIIATFVNATPNINLLRYSYLEQLKDLLPPLLMAGIMALAIYPISILPLPDIAIVALQIIIGTGIYLGESVIFKYPTFRYLLSITKKYEWKRNKNMCKDYNITGKKLLILAGADVHCKVVQAAKELGVYTIVTDYLQPKDSPAKQVADEFWMLNIMDVDGIVEKCKEEKVDGVLAFCIDPAQIPYQRICEKLNVPCYGTYEQFEIMTNKRKFKDYCLKQGVDVIPEYIEQEIGADLVVYPILVKPSVSRGSRGQTVCNNQEEAIRAIAIARRESGEGGVIIERYMLGKQDFSLAYIVIDSIPYLLKIGDRYLGNVEDNLERQHICTLLPSKSVEGYKALIEPKVKTLITSLGIKFGPIFLQGFIENNKVYFYDPGMRFPGSDFEIILKQATGFDPMKSMVRYALSGDITSCEGNPDGACYLSGCVCMILSFAARPGRIKVFEGLDKIAKDSRVFSTSRRYSVGETVPDTGDLKQRVAELVAYLPSRESMDAFLRYVYDTILILDENDQNMIVSKMGSDILFVNKSVIKFN